MRIDKFLKNSRIIKRRTVAKQACEQGKVKINDKVCKPGDEVKIGDKISINLASRDLNIVIKDIKDNVGKEAAADLYEEIFD